MPGGNLNIIHASHPQTSYFRNFVNSAAATSFQFKILNSRMKDGIKVITNVDIGP